MTIQFDTPEELPPLLPANEPVASLDALLAIDTVLLSAADTPRGILRAFYTEILGMTCAPALKEDPDTLKFSYQMRSVHLDRSRSFPGHLALLVRDFSNLVVRLRDRRIPHELLHADAGLTRAVYLRDPANNWIHLLETRPF